MVSQTKWTERNFEFSWPVGVFPCILERLRGTPARMEEIISILPKEILTVRIGQAWSIQEHVGHLLDLEELDRKRLEEFLSRAEVLTPADMGNRKTYDANHNTNSIQILLRKLRKGRQDLVRKLEELDEQQVAHSALHPRLNKPMRVVDWAYFVAEHDDHHIARMSELARTLLKNQ